MPVLLTESDVRAVLPMPDLIVAMEGALAEFSANRVVQPVRTVLEVAGNHALFAVMPAALVEPPALGAKLVTVYGSNRALGLPSHLASIVLFDYATGALTALLDGRFITEARTAAVSAVSVKHLSQPGASVLALIGSGVQAHSHLEAIRHVRRLADVRIWSPNPQHREAFAHRASSSDLTVRAVDTVSEAVRGANVIVLATSSRTPVLSDDDVGAGAHICAVGACLPDQREMPSALVGRARVFVDSRAGALKEAGDLLLAMQEGAITQDHIAGELGEVALGRLTGRRTHAEVTIFKSLGMAVEDIAAARLAVERALVRGLGFTFGVS